MVERIVLATKVLTVIIETATAFLPAGGATLQHVDRKRCAPQAFGGFRRSPLVSRQHSARLALASLAPQLSADWAQIISLSVPCRTWG
jgi:hypothetical protein